MLKLILLAILMSSAFASDCEELYNARHQSKQAAEAAFSCFTSTLPSATDNVEQARILGRISYLKFTIAEFFLELKLDALYEAFTTAEKAILLYGAKYPSDSYAALSEKELDVLAFAYYSYALSVSRFVDLKGKLEAIKRMEDIKKSLNTIIRMKRESTVFYGALRTLGIFHMKVPSIAGGQIQLSKPYFDRAIEGSLFRAGVSRYPGNNLARAEVLFKLGKSAEGCSELKVLVALTESDIREMDNGFLLETAADLAKARDLAVFKKCI